MSTDPTGLGNESCIEATRKKYINIGFDRSDWCGYDGDCLIDNMLFRKDETCVLCKYRVPIDVPVKLNQKMRQNNEILFRKFKI